MIERVSIETTASSREYKLLLLRKLWNEKRLCLFCADHYGIRRGENARRRTPYHSWKKYRAHQYR